MIALECSVNVLSYCQSGNTQKQLKDLKDLTEFWSHITRLSYHSSHCDWIFPYIYICI